MAVRTRRSPGPARLLAILALVTLAVLGVGQPALGATGWTGPTPILTADLWSARLGVDAAGKLHVVAEDDNGFLYRTNKSGTWKTTQLTLELRPWQDEPAMAVDASGHVFLAWATGCDCNAATSVGIEFLTNAKGGTNDGWPLLSRRIVTGKAYEPSLAVSGGKVHLAYRMGGRIHYLTNATPTNAWKDTLVSPKGTFASLPSIAIHPSKGARIAYVANDRIVLASNTGSDAAPVFSREQIPGATGSLPSLAIDPQGRPLVAWAVELIGCGALAGCVAGTAPAAPRIGTYLVRKGANGWAAVTAKRRVSAIAFEPQLLVDSHGRFHLLDGQDVISNASGAVTRRFVVPGFTNDTLSMALTAEGKARVIYLDDKDASGTTQALFLMKED